MTSILPLFGEWRAGTDHIRFTSSSKGQTIFECDLLKKLMESVFGKREI
jgi:hypothetical protein